MTDLAGSSPGAQAAPPPSLWTKFAYGFGSVAYGVKDNGFNYFLLIFYSQVLGGLHAGHCLHFEATDPVTPAVFVLRTRSAPTGCSPCRCRR